MIRLLFINIAAFSKAISRYFNLTIQVSSKKSSISSHSLCESQCHIEDNLHSLQQPQDGGKEECGSHTSHGADLPTLNTIPEDDAIRRGAAFYEAALATAAHLQACSKHNIDENVQGVEAAKMSADADGQTAQATGHGDRATEQEFRNERSMTKKCNPEPSAPKRRRTLQNSTIQTCNEEDKLTKDYETGTKTAIRGAKATPMPRKTARPEHTTKSHLRNVLISQSTKSKPKATRKPHTSKAASSNRSLPDTVSGSSGPPRLQRLLPQDVETPPVEIRATEHPRGYPTTADSTDFLNQYTSSSLAFFMNPDHSTANITGADVAALSNQQNLANTNVVDFQYPQHLRNPWLQATPTFGDDIALSRGIQQILTPFSTSSRHQEDVTQQAVEPSVALNSPLTNMTRHTQGGRALQHET